MTSHRWEYDKDRSQYACVKADIGLDDDRKCKGCGKTITDVAVRTFWGNERIAGLHTSLDFLAAMTANQGGEK